jgi:hypothetical protein
MSNVTIAVTNDQGLLDPASLIYTVAVPTYALTGPATGDMNVSPPFSVQLSGALAGTVVVTPNDGGAGGTFTPASVGLTTAAPSATFTYTPASSGIKTISATNDRGLANPASLSYNAIGLADNALISLWKDSSLNNNNGSMSDPNYQPFFNMNKTATGKPAVLCANGRCFYIPAITCPVACTCFAVMKPTGGRNSTHIVLGQQYNESVMLYYNYLDRVLITDGLNRIHWDVGPQMAGNTNFRVFTGRVRQSDHANQLYLDGNLITVAAYADGGAFPFTYDMIGYKQNDSTTAGGHHAEILLCDQFLSDTDRANAEKTLSVKYGTPAPPAGSVINLATLPIKGWWKADSLG